jgi:hypothetical protein
MNVWKHIQIDIVPEQLNMDHKWRQKVVSPRAVLPGTGK